MNVDDTVRRAILSFPLVSRNRFDVLHHILCVIGNGFKWENGEAVTELPNEYVEWNYEREVQKALDSVNPDLLKLVPSLDPRHPDHWINGEKETVEHVDERMHDMSDNIDNVRFYFYPQSQYALLVTVPEDVTADWQVAVNEMWTFAEKHGWSRP